jgi:predicted transcriptional regulator
MEVIYVLHVIGRVQVNMPIISINLDDDAEKKLCKIESKMNRSRSDTVRQIIREYELLDE